MAIIRDFITSTYKAGNLLSEGASKNRLNHYRANATGALTIFGNVQFFARNNILARYYRSVDRDI